MFLRVHRAVLIVIGALVALALAAFFIFFAISQVQKNTSDPDTQNSAYDELSDEEKQAILGQLEGSSSFSVQQKQDILRKINTGSSNTLTTEEKANILKGLDGH